MMIEVRVHFFAQLNRTLGLSELSIELPNGATASDALQACVVRFPDHSGLFDKIAIAINMEYCDSDARLCSGDEIALIPPVSGG